MHEHWQTSVLPDLTRFYRLDTATHGFLDLPWRWLREVILSLFGIPDSLTGAAFQRQQQRKKETQQ